MPIIISSFPEWIRNIKHWLKSKTTETAMGNGQMIQGAWAFLAMMAAATLGAFALTALGTWLGLVAWHRALQSIETPSGHHALLALSLFVGTAALVACKQRAR